MSAELMLRKEHIPSSAKSLLTLPITLEKVFSEMGWGEEEAAEIKVGIFPLIQFSLPSLTLT